MHYYKDNWNAFKMNVGHISKIRYRYSLEIKRNTKNQVKNRTLYVLLINPSEASINKSDSTTNKVLKLAKNDNYNRVITFNLLPFYATNKRAITSNDIALVDQKTKNMVVDENIIRIENRLSVASDKRKINLLIATGEFLDKLPLKNLKTIEAFIKSYSELMKFIRTKQSDINLFALGKKGKKSSKSKLNANGNPYHPSRGANKFISINIDDISN